MDGRDREPDAQDGAAAVEFAMIVGLLFLLIFGIIQFGILFAQGLALNNAAQQAARVAVVPTTGDCVSIRDEVFQESRTIALDQTQENFDFDVTLLPTPLDDDPDDMCPPSTYMSPVAAPPKRPCEGLPAGTEIRVVVKYPVALALPPVAMSGVELIREGTHRCEFA